MGKTLGQWVISLENCSAYSVRTVSKPIANFITQYTSQKSSLYINVIFSVPHFDCFDWRVPSLQREKGIPKPCVLCLCLKPIAIHRTPFRTIPKIRLVFILYLQVQSQSIPVQSPKLQWHLVLAKSRAIRRSHFYLELKAAAGTCRTILISILCCTVAYNFPIIIIFLVDQY